MKDQPTHVSVKRGSFRTRQDHAFAWFSVELYSQKLYKLLASTSALDLITTNTDDSQIDEHISAVSHIRLASECITDDLSQHRHCHDGNTFNSR